MFKRVAYTHENINVLLRRKERLNRSFNGFRFICTDIVSKAECVSVIDRKNDVDFMFTINLIQIKFPMTPVGESCCSHPTPILKAAWWSSKQYYVFMNCFHET